jgi:hypothetical protein
LVDNGWGLADALSDDRPRGVARDVFAATLGVLASAFGEAFAFAFTGVAFVTALAVCLVAFAVFFSGCDSESFFSFCTISGVLLCNPPHACAEHLLRLSTRICAYKTCLFRAVCPHRIGDSRNLGAL